MDSMAHYPEYNQEYYPNPHLLHGSGSGNHFQQSHAAFNHALQPRQQLWGGEAGAMPPPANMGGAMNAANSGTPGPSGRTVQQHQYRQQQQQYRQETQTQMRSSEFDATLIFQCTSLTAPRVPFH